MKWDKNGLVLADVPNSGGVSQRQTGSRGGNKLHDARSGKFTVGSGTNEKKVATPANVDPLAYKRQLDAVREAARTLDEFDEGSVSEFLKERATAPEQVDIAAFMQMVDEQRKSDLLDIIESSLRESKGEDTVRVIAPDGVVRARIAQLGAAAVGEITERLIAMGYEEAEVKKFFESRTESEVPKTA